MIEIAAARIHLAILPCDHSLGRPLHFRYVVAALALLTTIVATPPAIAQAAGFDVSVVSPTLSGFFGRSVAMRAEILTPNDYDTHPERRYPTLYVVHAFGPAFRPLLEHYNQWRAAIGSTPTPFVVVFLDATSPSGHNEFADSAQDGPWGQALTHDFIPALEAHNHLITRPDARFVAGHSSGGWSALWLQITYPNVFGGAWAIAPDPLDFHDFTGVDLVATPPVNFFRDERGADRAFFRVNGRDTSTLERFVDADSRHTGGQFDSFDAVFSPRGADGKPQPLFDRKTGIIDPAVAAYWEEHYDITELLKQSWPTLGPQLVGKINIFVGSQDTFHLESSVARFADAVRALGSDARISIIRGADHWSIFHVQGSLITRIVHEASDAYERSRALDRRASIHARNFASAP